MADLDDAEVREFVIRSNARSWKEVSIACELKFGRERAWPISLIKTVRCHAVKPGRYSGDVEVMSFIEDRYGLMTQKELRAEGIAYFGESRFPSKSRLSVIVGDLRLEAHLEAQALTGKEKPF